MIGTTLAGRYEIIARVGGGGMALVYKALDNLLNRYVAVKVLRQQFVHDEEFIRRFRREAQSAASLSHPNVVSIYDVGQEEDTHFIVMEYIEGHNLNEIIQERAPLQTEEAVRISIQICDALEHAHQNRIIHRDIKPHNILIGKNGRVKVTDFGIARAVTSSTITQTGSVVGSVHYFSPEHAKGVLTGEKSDLYSLGIVLYQMLTGKLPFLGESPISVALKHLQEPFDEPRLVNPHIPQSVENIILKSMRKNPAERYQSAAEMMRDLETCLSAERAHEQKLTFVSRVPFDDEQETRVMPAIRPMEKSAPKEYDTYAASSNSGAAGSPAPSPAVAEAKTRKSWVKPAIWGGVTLLFLAIMVGVVFYVKSLLVVKDVSMPNLINLTEQAAKDKLKEYKLEVEDPIVYEHKEGFEKGIVFDQSKSEGTRVKEGSTIRLYVSEGTPLVSLQDYAGKPFETAVQQLVELGFESTHITKDEVYHDDAEPGVVVGMSPQPNSQVDPKTASIKFTVSKGKESFGMPSLVGLTKDEAVAKIEANELKLAKDGIVEEPSYEPQGQVFMQKPFEPNDPVSKGSEVRIYVSSGFPPEALNYTLPLPVAPKEEGKNSTIRIVYTDARGENMEWGTEKIKSSQVLNVELVLAPNKDGVVLVYRDGTFLDTYPISYIDAKQGNVPIPEIDDPLARRVEGEGEGQEQEQGQESVEGQTQSSEPGQ
ncbi:Stk1 family PASTA domain-containing Ser/Thr kinase [Paenibacillus sp. MER TA 81-3]|uniref:Stk1 family PASTA domain-containing Ser/Thr kinase n=1 Tax=Paenibacillus sp. MER TA 81-3 TaxID=2939573 RepID=UPI00203FEB4B|nr:Stk1 family PASTA domain-containing Ser/Thr kinase [Paenibacillus sp. MER TA 81-3]MCM3337195.1 Stk1 family PASTA domain-containing Ser/Thr kinase [Paenibacillus sp. MER TA 81-3]